MPEFTVQHWTSIISPLLVIVGWRVIYSNAKKIARRSEEYAITNRVIDKVLALDKRCADYWLASGEREPAQHWIAGTLSEIAAIRCLLDILESHHEFKNKDQLIYKMRSAATLDAEKASSLTLVKLKRQKSNQSEAFSHAVQALYEHHRTKN